MMPEKDASVFKLAATAKNCMIFVRPSNPDSARYAGVSGFTSKPLSCKAKTANNSQHPLAGLVVDPTEVAEAFLPGRRKGAKELWKHFKKKLADPSSGYAVVQDGFYRGCLTLNGKFLYSDYDLLAVVPLDSKRKPIPNDPRSEPKNTIAAGGDVDCISPLVMEVRDWINANSGRPADQPMVHHGADFDDLNDYRPGQEMLDVFEPGGIHRSNVNYIAPSSQYSH